MEVAELNQKIAQAFEDAEEARIRLYGVLAVLVEDGLISESRARELGKSTIAEQRAYLRDAVASAAKETIERTGN